MKRGNSNSERLKLQMEFFKTDSFNSFVVEPEGDHINGRLLAVFDATGIAGGVFRVACAAVDRHSFGFSGALTSSWTSSLAT